MKQIKKKDLKEVIKLTKKYHDLECDDDGLYDELYQARIKAFGSPYTSLNIIVIYINNHQKKTKKKTTLNTYYKVFEALGYELV